MADEENSSTAASIEVRHFLSPKNGTSKFRILDLPRQVLFREK